MLNNFVTTSLSNQKFPWLGANFPLKLKQPKNLPTRWRGWKGYKKINQFHPLFIEGEILQRKTALFATTLTQRLIITVVVKIWPKFRNFNPVSGKRPKLLIFFTTVTAVLTLANCVLFFFGFQVNFHFLWSKEAIKNDSHDVSML